MAFFNRFPYTDFHELNLDWIISEMKALKDQLDSVLAEAIAQATANAEAYVDSKLGDIEAGFAVLQENFEQLDIHVDEIDQIVTDFTANVSAEITALKNYVDDNLEADRLQMVLLIQQNNEYLLNEMESYLANIKVINYFTGEKVTIQDMFNYLSQLHLSDSIDYNTMAARSKTYTQLANMNMTYTNLALHGNTLYV